MMLEHTLTYFCGDVGGDDGEEELLLVLLLALQPHPRLDAAARPLHRPLARRPRHVLVVQPHEVPDGEQEAVRNQLKGGRGDGAIKSYIDTWHVHLRT